MSDIGNTLESLIGYSETELLTLLDKEDEVETENGIEKHLFLGTVFNLTPTGKVYAPWSTNITQEEADKDEEFWEKLNELLSKLGLFVFSGEGDGCDVFVGKVI